MVRPTHLCRSRMPRVSSSPSDRLHSGRASRSSVSARPGRTRRFCSRTVPISTCRSWAPTASAQAEGYDDFLALGLIGLSYGGALLMSTYGFLAVWRRRGAAPGVAPQDGRQPTRARPRVTRLKLPRPPSEITEIRALSSLLAFDGLSAARRERGRAASRRRPCRQPPPRHHGRRSTRLTLH